jgi:hypothetical protein
MLSTYSISNSKCLLITTPAVIMELPKTGIVRIENGFAIATSEKYEAKLPFHVKYQRQNFIADKFNFRRTDEAPEGMKNETTVTGRISHWPSLRPSQFVAQIFPV